MFPSTISSRLGCSAAVIETLSPSQLSPAVIQMMWTSVTEEGLFVGAIESTGNAISSLCTSIIRQMRSGSSAKLKAFVTDGTVPEASAFSR
jgi:hypothetical protein